MPLTRPETPEGTSAAERVADDGRQLRPTRVALVGLSKFVDDIVTHLLDGYGGSFDICARLPASDDLLSTLRRSGADVLLCMLPEERMAVDWNRALDKRPPLAVVNLFDQEQSTRLYGLRSETVEVAQVDAEALIDLLIGARSPSAGGAG